MSWWQPRASGLWMEPGMANTSRPATPASRAVISEPELLRRFDHQRAVAQARDDAIALRESRPATGAVPGGNSEMTAPRRGDALGQRRDSRG